MKKSQLIGGIICLAVAAYLVVLNVMLPPEDIMFMVGGVNLPLLPPIILAFAGLGLIVTARKRENA